MSISSPAADTLAPDRRSIAEARLQLTCDGVRVQLEQRQGRWAVVDEESLRAELSVLDGLGAAGHTMGRALGICGALNACLIYPDEAKRLNRQLAELEERSPQRFRLTHYEEQLAITQACAWLSTEGAWRWLLWMLPKRLEEALQRTSWIVPGWHGWARRGMYWEFNGSFAHWLDDEFWNRMANHPDERFSQLAVASDPKAAPELLEKLADSVHVEIRDLAAVNPSTPGEAVERLVRRRPRYSGADVRVSLRALQNPSASPALLEEVATSELRRQDWLDDGDVGFTYLVWAVVHPRMPSRLLTRLERELTAGDRGRRTVRGCIARHRKSSPRLLRRLSADDSHSVRASVAQNSTAPPELLAELASDRHRRVRMEVAAHAATPPEALAILARDSVSSVRIAVARSLATPQAVLDGLTLDHHDTVATAAATNPSTSPQAAIAAQQRLIESTEDWAHLVCCLICEREDTPSHLLEQLAQESDPGASVCVAAHPSTPGSVLKREVDDALARDDQDVLRALWLNEALPDAERERVQPALRILHQRPPRRMTAEARKLHEARRRASREQP